MANILAYGNPTSYGATNGTSGATGTGQIGTNLVQTAYDQLIHWKLRSQPLFRSFADTRPSQLTNPGSTVRFQMVNGLTPVLTPLGEYDDPDSVVLGNTTTLDLSVAEWGNTGLATRRIQLFSLADVDAILATEIANNMADTIDIQAQKALNAKFKAIAPKADGTVDTTIAANSGVDLTSFSSGAPVYTGAGTSAITATQTLNSNTIRWATTKLRANGVAPTSGNLYGVVLHPEVSVDLRQEVGATAWRDVHTYSAPDAIFAGEVGAYEGARFIENPRCFNGQVGSGTGGTQTRVFNSFVLGSQALAEAVAVEPGVVIGPEVDSLRRFRKIGWYGVLGWSAFRTTAFGGVDAAYQILSSSSVHPNA